MSNQRFGISRVKQSPSPSSGVASSKLLSADTKISVCFASHVVATYDGLQIKLQTCQFWYQMEVSGVQPLLPPRNDPSAQCTPTRGWQPKENTLQESNHSQILNGAYLGIKKFHSRIQRRFWRQTNAMGTVRMTTTQAAFLSLRSKPEGRARRVSSQLN
jgi:hypothetical protein